MRRILVSAAGCAALLAASAVPAAAAPLHRKLVMSEAGSRLSTASNAFEDTYRIKRSPFGGGASIRDVTLAGTTFPASAKATVTSLFKDGRLTSAETLTLGPPKVNGVGSISGTGTCTGGTFKHQGETCTYKVRGSYDLVTGKTFVTLTGTYTPGIGARKHFK